MTGGSLQLSRQGERDSRPRGEGLTFVLVLSFLPYLSLGPLAVPSQVQPWAALSAWVWVLFKIARHGITLSGFQWLLIIFGLWFMLDIYGGQGFDVATYIRRSSAFLLSAGIVLATQFTTPAVLWRAIRIVQPLWFFFALLRYVSSGAYFGLVTPWVPTVVVSSARGSSSLAPEATDFGYTMVFMVLFCMLARRKLKDQGLEPERWPLILAVASALASLSGTGFFGLALVGLLYLVSRRAGRYGTVGRNALLAAAAVAAFFVLISLPQTDVRGVDLLSTSIKSPEDLMDSTASYRVVHNAVGVLGLVDSNFLGYGAGAYVSEAPVVYDRHDLGNYFGLTGYYANNVPATLSQSPVAYFAVILLEYGLLGVIYICLIFGFAARSQIPYRSIGVTLLAIAWAQSFPAAWPPFWVLLGLMVSPHFKAVESVQRHDQKGINR